MSWIAVAAAVAAGVGTYSKNRQVRSQTEEMNRREQAERGRQSMFQGQADERLQQILAEFSPEKLSSSVQGAQAARAAAMVPAQGQTPDYAPPTTVAAPKEIGAQAARKFAEARGKGADEAGRRAMLEAYGDANLGQRFALARGGQDINRLSGMSRRSAAILPSELQQAQKKGGNWALASDVSNTLSSILSMYGATRGAAGGGATVGPMGNRSAGDLARQTTGPYAGMNPYDIYGMGP